MNTIRLYLGIIIAAPVTILTALFYILPCVILGWYRYIGVRSAPVDKSPLGIGLVFLLVPEKAPKFLNNYWIRWGGHCVGSTVVIKVDPSINERYNTVLNHELHHVHQVHKLGFLQPILYGISSLICWIAGEKSYSANTFEVAARRAAGQVADTSSFTQGYLFCKNGNKK